MSFACGPTWEFEAPITAVLSMPQPVFASPNVTAPDDAPLPFQYGLGTTKFPFASTTIWAWPTVAPMESPCELPTSVLISVPSEPYRYTAPTMITPPTIALGSVTTILPFGSTMTL